MPQSIAIRPAQPIDYPSVDRLGRLVQADHPAAHPQIFRAGTTALTEDRYGDLLASPGARLLVAEDDQLIVGLMVLDRREAPDYPVFVPRLVVVDVLVVEPKAQGMGPGTGGGGDRAQRLRVQHECHRLLRAPGVHDAPANADPAAGLRCPAGCIARRGLFRSFQRRWRDLASSMRTER